MTTPKSILRTSSFRTKAPPKVADDDMSMFDSILSNFKPPFMRKNDATAPDAASKQSDERDDALAASRFESHQRDQTNGSNEEPSDERLNMSVTFDHLHKDDISTGVTFDLDHKDPTPLPTVLYEPMEKSLEITVENYVEFEALKRKRNSRVNINVEPKVTQFDRVEAEKKLKAELYLLRQMKENIEKEREIEALKTKLDEEMKHKAFMDKIRKEAELVEKLKQRVADVKESTRVKKVEVELKRARAEIERKKQDRLPAAPKIQERLQSTVDRLAAANTEQDLLELDVARIVARANNRKGNSKQVKSIIVPLSDASKRLLAPPPVKEKLRLPGNYKYSPEMDTCPLSHIERFEYNSANGCDHITLDSDDRESSYDVLTRPGYVKPAPTSTFGVFF
jgi:hypothetical protein